MRRLVFALAVGCAAALPAAAGACPSGLRPAAAAQLFFGRDEAAGVSDVDWRAFVDEEITPRFRAGLTVSDVYGQWRGRNGAFVREPSKALLLVLEGGPGEQARLHAVRAAYERRFRQSSVLLVEQKACVAF